MRLISKIDDCTGCGACKASCKYNAIQMITGNDGFYYPQIDSGICCDCGKCISVCRSSKENGREEIGEGYVCFNHMATRSASGGVFYTLAKYVIEELGGIVAGCTILDDYITKHIIIEQSEELYKLQGSKYIQSNIEDCYQIIQRSLVSGRWVLFSGTPCQVAALKAFLAGNDLSKLLCIDLICHGVASPLRWKNHFKEIETNIGACLSEISFRAKNIFEPNIFSLNFNVNGKKKNFRYYKDRLYREYIENKGLRTVCYSCRYAETNRVGDITIGDCATQGLYEDFHRGVTVSSCFINSKQGIYFWNECLSKQMKYMKLDKEKEISANKQLHTPVEKNGQEVNAKKIIQESIKRIFPTAFRIFIKKIIRRIKG